MKILILAVIVLAVSGCTSQHFTRTSTVDGVPTTTSYRALSFFNNGSTKGLTIDSATGKTSYGLKVTGQVNQVDNEGIQATFEGAGAAFGAGLKAAVK